MTGCYQSNLAEVFGRTTPHYAIYKSRRTMSEDNKEKPRTSLLRPKYVVIRINEEATQEGDGRVFFKGPHIQSTNPSDVNSPFVLMPRKDPAAFAALMVYAQLCEPQLSNEIRAWLRKIARAEPKFGTQGARNFTSVRLKDIIGNLG